MNSPPRLHLDEGKCLQGLIHGLLPVGVAALRPAVLGGKCVHGDDDPSSPLCPGRQLTTSRCVTIALVCPLDVHKDVMLPLCRKIPSEAVYMVI